VDRELYFASSKAAAVATPMSGTKGSCRFIANVIEEDKRMDKNREKSVYDY